MAAVSESALPEVRSKFDKPPGQFLIIHVVQAEILQPGRIDNATLLIEFVKSGMRSRVPSGIKGN